MEIEIVEYENIRIATVSDETKIHNVQDATDLLGNANYQRSNKIIIKEGNLDPQFFQLKSGIAGEILQKASNYHIQLAIIGEFEKYESKALNAFILECNRGGHIFFVPDMESALAKLKG